MSVFFASHSYRIKTIIGTFLILFIAVLKDNVDASGDEGFVRQPTVCVDIPTDLKLCHGVGYSRMVLPNLLNHESLDEVRQQAFSFVPLLSQRCHPYLQEFLCSLFAPVCLQPVSVISGPISPCKSLCKSVERSCTPIMKRHNFDWPQMLNCSRFTERDPCVNIVGTTLPSRSLTPTRKPGICAPCGTEVRLDSLHDNYCASEFVLKIKIRRVKFKKNKGLREIVADRRRRILYKTGPLSKRDLRKLKLVVLGDKKCSCPSLDVKTFEKKKKGKRNKAFFLVMGRKLGRRLLVTVLHSWSKKNKILKEAHNTNFNANDCRGFGNTNML